MQLRARLVHADAGLRVVQVSAWQGGQCLGSALGEAGDAEQAEERAVARLLERLEGQPGAPSGSDPEPLAGQLDPQDRPAPVARRDSPNASAPIRRPGAGAAPGAPGSAPATTGVSAPASPGTAIPPRSAVEEGTGPQPLEPATPQQPSLDLRPQAPVVSSAGPAPTAQPPPPPQPTRAPGLSPDTPPEPPPADPDDWSDELAALDLQLQRIGWQREQEATYLERAFGHPSRSRLTTYRDLSAYLQAVSQFAPGADPARAPVPLRRSELLGQCDLLLAQLGWDAARGRRFLEEQFQLASRQQLSDEQLLHFNMLLESELLSLPEAPTPPDPKPEGVAPSAAPPQAVVLPQTPGPGVVQAGPALPLSPG